MDIKTFFIRKQEKEPTFFHAFLHVAFILIIVITAFVLSIRAIDYPLNWEGIYTYRTKFIDGFIATLVISIFSLLLSTIIGTIFAFLGRSTFLPFYYLNKVYVEIIRGTPLLVQITLFYFVFGTVLELNNKYVTGIIILSFFAGAYVSEIIRAGIESIEKQQLETAKSLGLTPFQTYRLIIFPQVIKRITPPMAGQLTNIVKDSSLLSIISISELTKNVQEVDSITFATIENLLVLALLYMVLTMPISYLSRKLERRFHNEA